MIKKIYKKYEIIFNVVFFSIFPIMAFYLMEFYEHNPFEEVRFMAGFFNIILRLIKILKSNKVFYIKN